MNTRILTIIACWLLMCYARTFAVNINVEFVDADGSKSVSRNVDDDDKDEQWDKDQGVMNVVDDDLKKFKVTTSISDGTVSLTVVSGSSNINIWPDQKKTKKHAMEWEVAGGKFKSGIDDAPTNDEGTEGHFYVEGLANSLSLDDIELKAKIGNQEDTVNFSVIEVDLDVDSNNNERTTFESGSPEEDKIENSKKKGMDGWKTMRPGKFIVVNNGNTDDVPDWADGFNLGVAPEDGILNCVSFVPMLIQKSASFTDTDECEIKFEYDAADPKLVKCNNGSWDRGTNSKLRIWRCDALCRSKENTPIGDFIPEDTWIKWPRLYPNGGKVKLYIESIKASDFVGDLSIKVTMRQNGLECSDEIMLTSIEFISEPITSEGYNPAGLISGDNSAQFRCEIIPEDYPDAKIKWTPTGACNIPTGGEFGRVVCAGGTADNSEFTLSIDVLGMYTTTPRFHGKSLEMKNFYVLCHVLEKNDGSGALIDTAGIDTYITEVNQIFRQVGVQFSRRGAVIPIYNSGWYDYGIGYGTANSACTYLLSTSNASSDEIEIYFINRFAGNPLGGININEPSGLFFNEVAGSAIALGNAGADSIVLAHEWGHAFMLNDIYHGNALSDFARISWNPDDWNSDGEVSPRYYRENRQQSELVKVLIMNGRRSGTITSDIPLGTVYGYEEEGGTKSQISVGLNQIIANGRKPHH